MPHTLDAQRGAALLVALIVLVMVTLLAITASRFTLLGTRTSYNFQVSNSLFQASENGLVRGANLIRRGGAHPELFPRDAAQEPLPMDLAEPAEGPMNAQLTYRILPPTRVNDGGNSDGEGRGTAKKYRYQLTSTAQLADQGFGQSLEKGLSMELIDD